MRVLALLLATTLLGCGGRPVPPAVAIRPGATPDVAAVDEAPATPADTNVERREPDALPAFYPVPQDGHDGSVWASAWSPSGDFLATGGFDHTVRVWDLHGRLWIVLRGHRDAVKRLVFSPDGSELASSSRDGTVRVWSLRTGAVRLVLEHAGWDFDWSPDGATIVSVGPGPRSDSAIRVWNAGDGSLRTEVEAGGTGVTQLLSVAYASDGATLAAAGHGHLLFFDANDHRIRADLPMRGRFVAAPHEPTFWVGSGGRTLTVIDPTTGSTLRTLDIVGVRTLEHFAFSHDGRWLAAAGGYDRTAIIDARSGRVRTRFRHQRFVETLAFHPGGDLLAVAGGDTPQIVTHDVPSGRRLRQFGDLSRPVAWVAFSPDGARLATAGDDHAEIWDLTTGELLGGHELGRRPRGRVDQTMTTAVWSPDGELLAVGGGAERAWVLDGGDGSVVAEIRYDNPQDALIHFAWDAASENLAMVCASHRMGWRRASGAVTRTSNSPAMRDSGMAPTTARAQDGRLAVASDDRSIRIQNGSVTTTIPDAHERMVRDLAWMANGRLVSGGDDGRVRVWEPESGAMVRSLDVHEERAWRVAAHPVRAIVASASNHAWLSTSDRALGLRVYRHDGRPVGLFFDDHGTVGGDPVALERFFRVRSGPGILQTTLDDIPAQRVPFPLSPSEP